MAARSRISAGLLMYRRGASSIEVLLVHPGGPFWAKKDLGAWSLPKGEPAPGEDLLVAARREFAEETGFSSEGGEFIALGAIRQASGKSVTAWAFAGDVDASTCRSNTCEVVWPPRSGRILVVPEVDRAEWFTIDEARRRLSPSQVPFLDRLLHALSVC